MEMTEKSNGFVLRGIACIIGSCRFSKLYREVNRELTIRGWIVLDAGSYVYDETDREIVSRLNAAHAFVGELHHLKIALSNLVVLVAGPHNGQELYIGENSQADLTLAHFLHKPVLMWHVINGEFDKIERAISSVGA